MRRAYRLEEGCLQVQRDAIKCEEVTWVVCLLLQIVTILFSSKTLHPSYCKDGHLRKTQCPLV